MFWPPLFPKSSLCLCKQLPFLRSEPFDILVEMTPLIEQRQVMENWNKTQRDLHCCNHI